MKERFSEEQIIGYLREADKGVAVKELCRKHGFSEASYYLWRSKFGGMDVSDAKRLKALEAENAVSDRQPLIRPGRANEIWSVDFVFDRVASGRTLKCLAIVDDATHEAMALVAEHLIGGDHLARILDGICSQRGKPTMIRSDNDGAEFTGKAMLTWAHRNGIALRLIEPGKPNQNAYIV